MNYVLAHDVGTTGTKAVLVGEGGRVLSTAYEPYPTRYPQPLWAEQDPADWWRAVAATTRRVLEASGARPGEVQALTFATQMLDVICIDGGDNLIGTCISWLDGRAGEEAHLIMRKLGGPGIFAMLVGAAITGKDVLPKYLWLKRRAPEIYKQTALFLDATGYLLFRATGRKVCEWTGASVTGLFGLKSKTWDAGLMRFFGLDRSKFPDLVPSTARVGGLTGEAARALGLPEGTPVIAGAGDGPCAAVGSGAVGEGEGHLCLGTSGFAGIMTARKLTGKQGVATIQSADAGKLLLIGETETCGACLNWAAQELYASELSRESFARMDEDVARVAPGAGGLLFLPWLYGERCPVADESVRAAFINLGANHTRSQMVRAVYEGVAYNLRWILEVIAEGYGFRPDPLRVIGGGARGLPWLRIIADVSGRTLESIPNPQEAAAVGAALVGAVGLGAYSSVEATKQVVKPSQVVVADTTHQEIYARAYGSFKMIYPALRGLFHRLNAAPA